MLNVTSKYIPGSVCSTSTINPSALYSKWLGLRFPCPGTARTSAYEYTWCRVCRLTSPVCRSAPLVYMTYNNHKYVFIPRLLYALWYVVNPPAVFIFYVFIRV